MFNLAPVFAKRGARPSAKRVPQSLRRAGRKDGMTTITADPLMADPALATAPLLTFDVTAPDGTYAGAFQGSTPEDAILSYVATLGYASIDDAALAQGFADAATYMGSFLVTETLAPAGMDPSLAPLDPLAAPAALSRRGRRPCFVKMGAAVPIVDSMPSVDPGIVSAVTPVEATLRRYRAVVSRSTNATAVVEFDAYEDEDLYKLAEALVPQIPAEAWSVAIDPNNSWGYIDRIEPITPAADPALTTLSRRGRRGRKSMDFDAFEAEINRLIPGYGATDDRDLYAILDDIQLAMVDVEMANPDYANDPTWQGLNSLYTQLDAELASIESMMPSSDPALTTLSRRGRRGRKSADDYPAILDFLAGFTPEQIDSVVLANDWGMIGVAFDGVGYSGVYADGTSQPLDENTVAEIAYQLGYVAPAATLADDIMLPEDQLPLTTLSRRYRRKSIGEAVVALGTIVAGGAVGYLAGSAMGWIFSTLEDAYASLQEWWNEPSSADRTAQIQETLTLLRSTESTLAQQAAVETDPTYLAELNATLDVVRSVIASTEAELANPETLSEDEMLPEEELPPETLSRRSRQSIARRLALKATFTVADAASGEILGTYDATTSDDAILSYCAEVGYESVEAAAAGMGFATVDEFLASISVAEGAEAEPAPAETPAETLSRRHRMMRKAAFDIADPVTGEIIGTFDAGTIDDAILSYAASLGFASAEEAAAAAGVTVEEWLATFTVTEAVPAADAAPAEAEDELVEDEEEMPPAVAGRRRY